MEKFSKLGGFNPDTETFQNYVERMEQYFLATGTKNDKKVAVFLTVMGPEPYGILRNLVQPNLPKDKTFEELTQVLKDHYMPKPIVISERFKFNRRNQRGGEKIGDYVVALKKLAISCEFNDFLDDALRDRFVCGIQAEAIQRKLLAEERLTFKGACDMAATMEMAELDTASFQPVSGSTGSVNALQKREVKKRFKYKPKKMRQACRHCGKKNHDSSVCRMKDFECHKCKVKGHIAKVCPRGTTAHVDVCSSDEELNLNGVYQASSGKGSGKIILRPEVGGSIMPMELDTGSSVSIVSENVYKGSLSRFPLKSTDLKLKSYSGDPILVLGQVMVPVKYDGSTYDQCSLIVAKGNRPALFGRNWMEKIRLNWTNIFSVNICSLESLRQQYSDLWNNKNGAIKGFKASIRMKENAKPIFCKARPVPYAIKETVEKEFSRMERENIVYKVKSSEWATPLVIVPKPDKSVRICADYKVTVNREINEEQYPIPNTEDLFATLAGGKKFTKLDLSQAYAQLELDKDSEELLTVNTHMGLYRYRRLVYGISSSPAIFQSVMDKMLSGIQNVVCRIDDILITGPDDISHLRSLQEVLQRLSEQNVKLNEKKCSFMQDEVVYMGHLVDKNGIRATEDKVEAIQSCPEPENVSQLKSYLGLIGYYRAFLPDIATVLHPLHELLKKGEKWTWSTQCTEAFDKSKDLVVNSGLLVHYDMRKPVTLACDSSSYGTGCVLSHIMDDGSERPIAFHSRTLSTSEKNYSSFHREALGLLVGVKKFHKYLFGRKFTLITDHQSLTTIFGPKTGVPTMAAARLQRWAVTLSAYDYDIKYRKSADHANCDFLSRLPVVSNESDEEDCVSFIDEIPLSANDIKNATRKHPVLSKVYEYTLNGWPGYVKDVELKPYFARRNELSIHDGVILWGLRVIIPEVFQDRLLAELHEEHIGMTKMKALARSYVWWNNIDADIEQTVRECATCMSVQNSPAEAPLHPWRWATRPWQRIHIDYAEFQQQVFLVVTDSYSKWLEIIPMKSTTSAKTIDKLRGLFSTWGVPETLVSDNDPRLSSEEVQNFMKGNGIKHTFVPPYHPSSNGSAERAVQILKKSLKKQLFESKNTGTNTSISFRLANFLFKYRNSPHSLTKETPAVLFLKRQPRTRLSLLRPNKERDIEERQEKTVKSHDRSHTTMRKFRENDGVLVKTTLVGGKKWKWMPGTIREVKGPLTYLVLVGHRIRYCHVDHLRKNESKFTQQGPINSDIPETSLRNRNCQTDDNTIRNKLPVSSNIRYSSRKIKPPDKLNL